jgi:hypothetical protein
MFVQGINEKFHGELLKNSPRNIILVFIRLTAVCGLFEFGCHERADNTGMAKGGPIGFPKYDFASWLLADFHLFLDTSVVCERFTSWTLN